MSSNSCLAFDPIIRVGVVRLILTMLLAIMACLLPALAINGPLEALGSDVDTLFKHEEYSTRLSEKTIAGETVERFTYTPEGLIDTRTDGCQRTFTYERNPNTLDLDRIRVTPGVGPHASDDTPDLLYANYDSAGRPETIQLENGVSLLMTASGTPNPRQPRNHPIGKWGFPRPHSQ